MKLPAYYYQQFDADFSREVPAEGFGGWKTTEIEMIPERTAVVVMHAWDSGTRERYPGWHRVVEFFPRADVILKNVFPPLLTAVRASRLRLYHVTSGSYYCQNYPGYQRAVALTPTEPVLVQPPRAPSDPGLEQLVAFKQAHGHLGTHNKEDIERGFRELQFPIAAEPQGDEGVAATTSQLTALCQADGVNHLLYAGFAINECLMMSPGGMVEMSRRGFMCSAIRQAVTAVENKETARQEWGKEVALWRVARSYGFVFDAETLIRHLSGAGSDESSHLIKE